MNPEDEPTADEISKAWTEAIELEGLPGMHSCAVVKLREIRLRKNTWFGDEIKLMHAVDRYLLFKGV